MSRWARGKGRKDPNASDVVQKRSQVCHCALSASMLTPSSILHMSICK
jgi:hypothetical protein